MIERVKLGKVDYFGKNAIAYREIYPKNVWMFVLEVNGDRIELITY